MREIKCRAWDIDNKQFVYAHIGQDDVWLDDGISTIEMPLHHSDFELCTGLKDKNGKEIYDGDIIHEKWYDSEAHRGKDRIGKVEYFCDGYFCYFRGEFTALGMFPPKHIEVIGNIHENSELLRDKERR